MNHPSARCNVRLRFPIDLPGGRVESVLLDLNRPGRVDPNDSRSQIARIIGLPASLIDEMVESDYLRLLLKIEELNTPRLAPQAVR